MSYETAALPKGMALRVRQLSKCYHLYDSSWQRIRSLLLQRPEGRVFTALNAVSFELPAGRTLGLIGDNGAGKSTLLQLIAGALTPSAGTIECRGQVLGLLELGLGFHPEFTGRENIYFYADVLGLPRGEVRKRFTEIAAFSELGDFIERPLKTYSTGMRMRLAFALVSSLDPDILLVDEALAVGDLHFQKKCIDRMTAIKERGRTIIFCSHSTYQVGIFCDEVLWIKDGRIHAHGTPGAVIPHYEAYQAQKDAVPTHLEHTSSPQTALPVHISELEWLGTRPLRTGQDLVIRLRIECQSATLPYNLTISIKMDNGRGVFVTGTHLSGRATLKGRVREVTVTFPKVPLLGGIYTIHARIFDDHGLMLYHELVLPGGIEVAKEGLELGICSMEHRWEI